MTSSFFFWKAEVFTIGETANLKVLIYLFGGRRFGKAWNPVWIWPQGTSVLLGWRPREVKGDYVQSSSCSVVSCVIDRLVSWSGFSGEEPKVFTEFILARLRSSLVQARGRFRDKSLRHWLRGRIQPGSHNLGWYRTSHKSFGRIPGLSCKFGKVIPRA